MRLICDRAQSHRPAAHWHDGQITCKGLGRLKMPVKHQTSDHDIAGVSLKMQRARHAAGDPVDRTRDKLDDGVVESMRRKFGAIHPGFVRLLEQLELHAGETKALADARVRLPLQRRRHDVRNLDIKRMIELHVDGADSAILDVGKKAAQQGLLQMEQVGGSAKSGNNMSAHCYRQNENSPLIPGQNRRRGAPRCQLTVWLRKITPYTLAQAGIAAASAACRLA